MSTQQNGGDAVILALRAAGIRHVFGVLSIHNLPIFDALARDGVIEVVSARHEQAAVHAADGYARASGGVGVAITSSGPGAANAVPGLYEAKVGSSRVIMLTGQVDSRHYGANRGSFHEAEEQREMLQSVARTVESVRDARDIAHAVLRVVADVNSGRPQPGAVEIPIDVQRAAVVPEVPALVPPMRAYPDEELVSKACEAIAHSRRPLLWAGGGVLTAGASAELIALAERLSAPVLTTIQGRGAMPEDHPLCLGANALSAPIRTLIADADCLVAIGTRFKEDETAGWRLQLPVPLIHVDADVGSVGRSYHPTHAIVADAQLCLRAILNRRLAKAAQPGWAERAADARATAERQGRELIGPEHAAIMDSIRRRLPRSGIVVRDATVPAYMWGDRLLPIFEPGTSIWPASGAIGPGLPLAIGAAIGSRRRVILIQGDGGFMLNIGELATASQYRVPLTICLFNDRGYGVLRTLQDRACSGRRIGVDLHTPDFVAAARAFQVDAESVASPAAFDAALQRALATEGPYLIEIDLTALAPLPIAVEWYTS